MIVSVSRRTDIPAFFDEWFFNRLKEGFVDVVNPFNSKQGNRISLKKEDVDCFVFWTKNPEKFLNRIEELDGYNYYFQFTLNSYGVDIEPNVPSKSEKVIEVFKKLSLKIGKEKVIWRYDPIILTDKYTIDYHIKYFDKLASLLSQYTEKCVISFLDLYKKTKKNMREINVTELNNENMDFIANAFSKICKKYGLILSTCCEEIDLDKYGIKHNKCIDDELIERISGKQLKQIKKDNQRGMCGCIKSVDIGVYNTCLHNCKYCYANYSNKEIIKNVKMHDKNFSFLLKSVNEDIKIYEK